MAATAVIAACAPTRSHATLKIGYQRNGVLLLARSRNRIGQALDSTKIGWVEFPSGPPLLEALSAGAVDFGATGDAPPIFAQAAGAPLRYVAVQPISGQGEAVVIPPGSPIRSAHDLRGRRIAFTKASSSHLLIIKALASAGLSLADVQPVYLAPSDASAALAQHAIDAWATWDPYLALAERDQHARILISGADLPPSDSFYLASRRLTETRPDLARVLLDGLRQAAAWGEAHASAVVDIVAKANGLPSDVVQTSLRRGPLAVDPLTPDVLARQQAAADTFASLGIIPRRITVADAVWTGWSPKT
jgi:sulfonate transport system substrate-binding protein